MTALVVAPSNNSWIYAAQNNVVYYTSNGGGSWTNITDTLPVGSAGIFAMTVSPTKPNRVWVTFSGYSAGNKVFESKDAGNSWTNISGGLPNLPVNCIVYQPGLADGIYVGTDQGVYYHDTVLNTWVDYSNNLPNTVVMDLKISKASGNLLAATYGRGTWETSTYTPPVAGPVANFNAYPTTFCVGDSVQFTDQSTNQPNQWSWTFQGASPSSSTLQNPTIAYPIVGTYSVSLTATNAKGNSSITKTSFINVFAGPPLPVINVVSNTTLTCSLANMSSYQWFYNNVLIPGATSVSYTQLPMLTQGRYSIEATNDNGCSNLASVVFIPTGISGVLSEQDISIYPNPSNGNIQVACNLPEADYTISVSNIIGKVIYTQKAHIAGPYNTNLNLSAFGAGVYLLSIKGEGSQVVKKLVVY